jgi:hypothetical protein
MHAAQHLDTRSLEAAQRRLEIRYRTRDVVHHMPRGWQRGAWALPWVDYQADVVKPNGCCRGRMTASGSDGAA